MAAAKPEVHLCQITSELATKFQRLYPCYRRFQTKLCYMRHHRKFLSVENPRWRPPNQKYYYLSVGMS